jgi:hypothetical protein
MVFYCKEHPAILKELRPCGGGVRVEGGNTLSITKHRRGRRSLVDHRRSKRIKRKLRVMNKNKVPII